MSLPEIEKYIAKQYKSIPENIANTTLNYLVERLNIKNEFLRVGGRMLYYLVKKYTTQVFTMGNLELERCDPLYCDFDKRPGLECIEDGDWVLKTL